MNTAMMKQDKLLINIYEKNFSNIGVEMNISGHLKRIKQLFLQK